MEKICLGLAHRSGRPPVCPPRQGRVHEGPGETDGGSHKAPGPPNHRGELCFLHGRPSQDALSCRYAAMGGFSAPELVGQSLESTHNRDSRATAPEFGTRSSARLPRMGRRGGPLSCLREKMGATRIRPDLGSVGCRMRLSGGLIKPLAHF